MARPYSRLLAALSLSRVIFGCAALLIFKRNDVEAAFIASGLFIIAQATDHVDGFVARHFSTPNRCGYLQDSLGDKIFQFSLILSVTREYDLALLLPWFAFFREACLLSIRVLKDFTHDSLLQLRSASIAYAFFMRGGVAALVLTSPISQYLGVREALIINVATLAFFLSILPGTLGIFMAAKSPKSGRKVKVIKPHS